MTDIQDMTKENFEKLNIACGFSDNGYQVVIFCRYIQTWQQLAEALGNAFQLPMRNEGFDGTWDWMTDLSWLGKTEKIVIYLYEEQELLKNDCILKTQVMSWLEDLIRFWKEDIKHTFVARKHGKVKNFEIYSVN